MRHSFAPFDAECEDFLSKKLGIDFFATDWAAPNWLCVSCRDDDGQLMGVCAFEFQTWFDAHFSIAVRDKRFATRRGMRAMFTAVFSCATRVTAFIEPWNTGAIRQARLMGFQPEGYMRNAVEGNRDALVFGMLKDDCRYLRKIGSDLPQRRLSDGQVAKSA